MAILKIYGDSSVTSYRLRIGSKRIIAYYIDSLPIGNIDKIVKFENTKLEIPNFNVYPYEVMRIYVSTTRQHTSCQNWRSLHTSQPSLGVSVGNGTLRKPA